MHQQQFIKSLRTNPTDAESKLWKHLRAKKLQKYKFRRQVALDHFIVDFICFRKNLIIEIDGGQHNFDENQKYDAARTAYLKQLGFKVLRFWNNDVLRNLSGVVHAILIELGEEV